MTMEIKVCHITTEHSVLDDRIFYKEAVSLVRDGYDVSVLGPMDQSGTLYDMGKLPVFQQVGEKNGVKCIGFELPTPLLQRMLKLGGGVPRQLWKNLTGFVFRDAVEKALLKNADVYHCHEIWAVLIALRVKELMATNGRIPKIIWDIHEYLPARLNRGLKSVLGRILMLHSMKKLLPEVDYVITANQITRGHILTLYRFARVEVLYNTPPLWLFKEYASKHNDKIVICHEGSFPFNRGLKDLIEVIRLLREKYQQRVELRVIGDFYGNEAEFVEQKIREYHLDKIFSKTGWLPYEQVGEALAQCDIGIIFMEYTENNMLAGPPNKLFNYMRYGLPIVAVDLPETRRILSHYNCGLVVEQRSPEALYEALCQLIENSKRRTLLGENARFWGREKFSWEVMEKRLGGLYEEVTRDFNFSE